MYVLISYTGKTKLSHVKLVDCYIILSVYVHCNMGLAHLCFVSCGEES